MIREDAESATLSGRTVYLVLSHGRIPQLLRLLRTVRAGSPHATVVVHHDGHAEPLDEAAARAAGADHLIEARRPVRWGELSLVDALLRSLRWIDANVDYDWVVQLSGQDYPTRPLRDLEAHLAAGDAGAYVRHERVGSELDVGILATDGMVRRYFFGYRRLPGGAVVSRLVERRRDRRRTLAPVAPTAHRSAGPSPGAAPGWFGGWWRRFLGALDRVPAHVTVLPRGLGVKVGWRIRSTPFTADYPCWKGSFWATLSRPTVAEVLHQLDERTELLDQYRHTVIPEESVLPTVLANSPNVRLSGEPLRFVSWVAGAAHPCTLGIGDLPAIDASNAFLARKFDQTLDADVLDELDRRLAGPAASECPVATDGRGPSGDAGPIDVQRRPEHEAEVSHPEVVGDAVPFAQVG